MWNLFYYTQRWHIGFWEKINLLLNVNEYIYIFVVSSSIKMILKTEKHIFKYRFIPNSLQTQISLQFLMQIVFIAKICIHKLHLQTNNIIKVINWATIEYVYIVYNFHTQIILSICKYIVSNLNLKKPILIAKSIMNPYPKKEKVSTEVSKISSNLRANFKSIIYSYSSSCLWQKHIFLKKKFSQKKTNTSDMGDQQIFT